MDELVRYYFQKGFSYKNMLLFYQSAGTRPKCLCEVFSNDCMTWIKTKKYFNNIQEIRHEIVKNLNRPGCSGGLACPQVERYSSTTTRGGGALSRVRPCWLLIHIIALSRLCLFEPSKQPCRSRAGPSTLFKTPIPNLCNNSGKTCSIYQRWLLIATKLIASNTF